jgi:hypothetical protein
MRNLNQELGINIQSDNEYSNSYGRRHCKKHCKEIFVDKELVKVCKKQCKVTCKRKSKCYPKGETPYPTEAEILTSVGMTPELEDMEGGILPTTAGINMSNKTLLIGGGIVVLGVITLLIFKRR